MEREEEIRNKNMKIDQWGNLMQSQEQSEFCHAGMTLKSRVGEKLNRCAQQITEHPGT